MPSFHTSSTVRKLLLLCSAVLLLFCLGLFSEIIRLRGVLKDLDDEMGKREELNRIEAKFEKEQKRLKKEIDYWKIKSEDREKRKPGTAENSSPERKNLFELVSIGGNNQIQILGKMGISPTPQDFKKILVRIGKEEKGELKDTSPQTRIVADIIADWFKCDKESLCQWAANLHDKDPVSRLALQEIVKEWPIRDTQGFSRFLETLRGEARDNVIVNAIYKFGGTSPEFSASLAGKIKNESLLQEPIANLTKNMFLKNPEKTHKWLDTISSPALKDIAIETYVSHVASGDMDKAIGVIAEISSETSRETAMTYLIKETADKFPQKAADIINEYPEGQSKQNLIRCFTTSISGTHPETAMLWADQIDDESTRVDTMVHLSKIWMSKDMDSFSKWFKQADLSSLEREQMQKYYDDMMAQKKR